MTSATVTAFPSAALIVPTVVLGDFDYRVHNAFDRRANHFVGAVVLLLHKYSGLLLNDTPQNCIFFKT